MEPLQNAAQTAAPSAAAPAAPGVTRPAPSRRRLPRIFAGFTKAGRQARARIDARAELGHELLAGRVSLRDLKGRKAEPYLQGLDVLECRHQRMIRVLSARAGMSKRSLWRLSPQDRATRKLPDTPTGRRHQAWLEDLELAGLIRRLPAKA